MVQAFANMMSISDDNEHNKKRKWIVADDTSASSDNGSGTSGVMYSSSGGGGSSKRIRFMEEDSGDGYEQISDANYSSVNDTLNCSVAPSYLPSDPTTEQLEQFSPDDSDDSCDSNHFATYSISTYGNIRIRRDEARLLKDPIVILEDLNANFRRQLKRLKLNSRKMKSLTEASSESGLSLMSFSTGTVSGGGASAASSDTGISESMSYNHLFNTERVTHNRRKDLVLAMSSQYTLTEEPRNISSNLFDSAAESQKSIGNSSAIHPYSEVMSNSSAIHPYSEVLDSSFVSDSLLDDSTLSPTLLDELNTVNGLGTLMDIPDTDIGTLTYNDTATCNTADTATCNTADSDSLRLNEENISCSQLTFNMERNIEENSDSFNQSLDLQMNGNGSVCESYGATETVQSSFNESVQSSFNESVQSSFAYPFITPQQNKNVELWLTDGSNSYNVTSGINGNSYNVTSGISGNSYNVTSGITGNSYNVSSGVPAVRNGGRLFTQTSYKQRGDQLFGGGFVGT